MFLEGGEVVAPPETQKFVDKAEVRQKQMQNERWRP